MYSQPSQRYIDLSKEPLEPLQVIAPVSELNESDLDGVVKNKERE